MTSVIPVFTIEDSADLNKKLNGMKLLQDSGIPFGIKIRNSLRYENGYAGLFGVLGDNGIYKFTTIIVDIKSADIPSEIYRQLRDTIGPLSKVIENDIEYELLSWTVRYDSMASNGFEEAVREFQCEYNIKLLTLGVIELTSTRSEFSIIDMNKIPEYPLKLYKKLTSEGVKTGFVLPGPWVETFLKKGYSGSICCPGLRPAGVDDIRRDQVKVSTVESIVNLNKQYGNKFYIILGRLANSEEGLRAYLREMGYNI